MSKEVWGPIAIITISKDLDKNPTNTWCSNRGRQTVVRPWQTCIYIFLFCFIFVSIFNLFEHTIQGSLSI